MTVEERIPGIRNDIQIIPVTHEGEQVFYIRDVLGLCPEGLVLRKPVVDLLTIMLRCRSVRNFQVELTRLQGGMLVSDEDVRKFIRQMDEIYILETPRYRKARADIIERFESMSLRPPALAGKGYPDKPESLERFLSRCLDSAPDVSHSPIPGELKALVAPHIDLSVGGETYGNVYRYLPRNGINRIIVLGIGHVIQDGYFCVTDKDFQLPNGVLKTDKEAVSYLRSIPGGAVSSGDFYHRDEHSIEFQALFIRHLIDDNDIRFIPILCGSFDPLLRVVDDPMEYLSVSAFVNGLKDIVSDKGTLVVAGVDLCHVGPKFGDTSSAGRLEGAVRKHDELILKALMDGDARRLWRVVQAEGNRYHVCGLSALMVLLSLGLHLEGAVLDHQVWFEDVTRSAVSYAGAVLWTPFVSVT